MADKATFDHDIRPHLQSLKRTTLWLTRDRYLRPDLAEDLYQDTLLKALDKYDSFQKGTNLGAWLNTIARHHWYDQEDERKRRPDLIPLDNVSYLRPAPGPSVEDRATGIDLEDPEVRKRVLAALEALRKMNPAHADTWWRTAHDGQSNREVAAELGISENTVGSQRKRAQDKVTEAALRLAA